MADRHGPFVPDVPEVQAGEYVACSSYETCKRRDGHLGACLPSPMFGITVSEAARRMKAANKATGITWTEAAERMAAASKVGVSLGKHRDQVDAAMLDGRLW